jgi:hypothetical protein
VSNADILWLIPLVHPVSLVHLVYPVSLVQPNKQDKPNKPNNSLLILVQIPVGYIGIDAFATHFAIGPEGDNLVITLE